jgi:hypothetical protein
MFVLSIGRSLTRPNAAPLRLSFKKTLGRETGPHPIAAPYDQMGPKKQAPGAKLRQAGSEPDARARAPTDESWHVLGAGMRLIAL